MQEATPRTTMKDGGDDYLLFPSGGLQVRPRAIREELDAEPSCEDLEDEPTADLVLKQRQQLDHLHSPDECDHEAAKPPRISQRSQSQLIRLCNPRFYEDDRDHEEAFSFFFGTGSRFAEALRLRKASIATLIVASSLGIGQTLSNACN